MLTQMHDSREAHPRAARPRAEDAEMCRICKKEGRWVDALGFLMMGHASKYGGFNAGSFLKD